MTVTPFTTWRHVQARRHPRPGRRTTSSSSSRSAQSPLHIVGEPVDQALLIHYLLSDAAKFATGNIFRVNGGQAMAVVTESPSRPETRRSSLLERLLDGFLTRLARLPAPTSDYTVTRDLRIPTRDGVELLADMYTPTGTTVRDAPRAVAVRLPGADGRGHGHRVREPWLPRPARPVPRHVRFGRRVRADGPRGRRRRRHRRLDARAAVVRGSVRHLGRLVPRVHAVGAARGSAPGARHRGHLDRPARLPRRRVPGGRVQPQRLPRLVQPGRPAGGRRLRGRPCSAGFGPSARGHAGRRGAAARRRRRSACSRASTVVPRVGQPARPRRSRSGRR